MGNIMSKDINIFKVDVYLRYKVKGKENEYKDLYLLGKSDKFYNTTSDKQSNNYILNKNMYEEYQDKFNESLNSENKTDFIEYLSQNFNDRSFYIGFYDNYLEIETLE